MLWSGEQYIDLMTCGRAERPMFCELFGPLVGLEEQWRRQGASERERTLDAFDFDRVDAVGCGGATGLFGGPAPREIERTADYAVTLDEYGRKTKLYFRSATIPLPLEYPVKDMDGWRKIKPLFEFREERIDDAAVEAAGRARAGGALVLAWIPGGFSLPRELMGEAALCLGYYDNPELLHDMLDTVADTAFRVLDRVSDRVPIDNLCVSEDLAGKSGPLIGPATIAEFIRPYYRRIWDMLRAKGTRLFSLDSDGNLNAVVDAFLDCGVNVLYPLEPAAFMDVVALRKKYGSRLAFKGGIDKHVLRQDRSAIKKELEYKLQDCLKTGMAFGLDHRITDGTPIENYRYYVDTARGMLGMGPRDPARGKWVRMAF